MDLQTRKPIAIEYLAGLNDEQVFREIETSINCVRKKHIEKQGLQSFSKQQLVDRAKKANLNYHNGETMTQEQLEEKSSEIFLIQDKTLKS